MKLTNGAVAAFDRAVDAIHDIAASLPRLKPLQVNGEEPAVVTRVEVIAGVIDLLVNLIGSEDAELFELARHSRSHELGVVNAQDSQRLARLGVIRCGNRWPLHADKPVAQADGAL